MTLLNKTYNNIVNFKNDFKGKDLSGSQFINCDLSGVSFSNSKLKYSKFSGCYVSNYKTIDFKESDLKNSIFEECIFPGIILENTCFENAQIHNCDFRKGNLVGCRFDGSSIEKLNISLCRIHLSSFLNTKIVSIQYLPALKIPYMRGLALFSRRRQILRTVFINYNTHLTFTGFCHNEARKDMFYASASKNLFLLREVSILIVALFGILTGYGTSLRKWTLCTLGIIFIYALGINFSLHDSSFYNSLELSTLFFLNIESVNNHPISKVFVTESIVGIFMLGILITLLTSKIVSSNA